MNSMSRDVSAKRTATTVDVAAKLAALPEMAAGDLRAEWRRLYRAHPPQRIGRRLLELGVAWKIQEKAYGGFGAATKGQLANLAQAMEENGDIARNRIAQLKPGAKLLREWQGKNHTVIVLEDGFEWECKRWRSLSAIARTITGAHWSGPRFFGLQAKTEAAEEVGSQTGAGQTHNA